MVVTLREIGSLRYAAAAFANEQSISYPVLVGDAAAVSMSRSLGNSFGGLPFTVVVDRNGKLSTHFHGSFERAAMEQALESLLPEATPAKTS